MPRFYYISGAQVLDGGETPFLKRRNKRQKRLVGIYVGKWVGVWYLDVDRRVSLLVYYVVALESFVLHTCQLHLFCIVSCFRVVVPLLCQSV